MDKANILKRKTGGDGLPPPFGENEINAINPNTTWGFFPVVEVSGLTGAGGDLEGISGCVEIQDHAVADTPTVAARVPRYLYTVKASPSFLHPMINQSSILPYLSSGFGESFFPSDCDCLHGFERDEG